MLDRCTGPCAFDQSQMWMHCRYKAAGDSKLLQALGESHSIKVDIVNLVEAGTGGIEGQVSSSKIRHALNCGHMEQVAESLGRPYRLVAEVAPKDMCLVPDGLQDSGLRSGHNAKHAHLRSWYAVLLLSAMALTQGIMQDTYETSLQSTSKVWRLPSHHFKGSR